MKTKVLFGILFFIFCILGFASCSEDEGLNPITLVYEDPQILFDNEGRSFTLTPFGGETTPLYIKGGDGNYKITNSNEEVVRVNYDGTKISFQAQSLGDATIKIEDTAHSSYILSITVKYREFTTKVVKRKYSIKGDELTVGQKAKLEEEIKTTDRTDKYVFTYKDAENSKGSVCIEDEEGKRKVCDFTDELIKLSEEDAIVIAGKYKLYEYNKVIMEGESDREVIYVTKNFLPLLETKMVSYPRPTYCYIKDLTERYKSLYPEVEQIWVIYGVMGR